MGYKILFKDQSNCLAACEYESVYMYEKSEDYTKKTAKYDIKGFSLGMDNADTLMSGISRELAVKVIQAIGNGRQDILEFYEDETTEKVEETSWGGEIKINVLINVLKEYKKLYGNLVVLKLNNKSCHLDTPQLSIDTRGSNPVLLIN